MESNRRSENGSPPMGLRERLTHANATPAPPAETLESMSRLAEHQRMLSEMERNLAYTVETLQRQADRTGWLQTGVIVLALIAGMLGGMTAGLVILAWMR